jgi:hypothetical protein
LESTEREKEIEEWAEYRALCRDDDETALLRERGIVVEFYDATRKPAEIL